MRVPFCFMSVGPYGSGGVLSHLGLGGRGSPKSILGKTRDLKQRKVEWHFLGYFTKGAIQDQHFRKKEFGTVLNPLPPFWDNVIKEVFMGFSKDFHCALGVVQSTHLDPAEKSL